MTDAWSLLPRRDHLRLHIDVQDREWFALLLRPLSMTQIAEMRGPGWTRRQGEGAITRLMEFMAMEIPIGPHKLPYLRLAWLRVAYGIERCWCERDEDGT